MRFFFLLFFLYYGPIAAQSHYIGLGAGVAFPGSLGYCYEGVYKFTHKGLQVSASLIYVTTQYNSENKLPDFKSMYHGAVLIGYKTPDKYKLVFNLSGGLVYFNPENYIQKGIAYDSRAYHQSVPGANLILNMGITGEVSSRSRLGINTYYLNHYGTIGGNDARFNEIICALNYSFLLNKKE